MVMAGDEHGKAGDRPVTAECPDYAEHPAVVTPYPDGPLLLRGDFAIVTVDGDMIPAGRRTVALCRCGHSARKPFCDGSHALIGFKSASRADQPARPGASGSTAPQRGRRVGRPAQPPAGIPDAATQPKPDRQPAAD